jgi:hypothetical protein
MADSTITGLDAVTPPLSGSELLALDQSGTTFNAPVSELRKPFPVQAIAYATNVTINLSTYAWSPLTFEITLTGDLVLGFSNGFDGQIIRARLVQDGTGGRSLSLDPASIGVSGDLNSIILSSAASKVDYLLFEWRSANSKANLLATNMGFAA